jgi:hypothetical protein
LMLYRAVADRSGVVCQEYHGVGGGSPFRDWQIPVLLPRLLADVSC